MVHTKIAAGLLAGVALALSSSAVFAQTEVTWWHAMGAELGERLEAIAADFNASQTQFKLSPLVKRRYREKPTPGLAALRAQHAK